DHVQRRTPPVDRHARPWAHRRAQTVRLHRLPGPPVVKPRLHGFALMRVARSRTSPSPEAAKASPSEIHFGLRPKHREHTPARNPASTEISAGGFAAWRLGACLGLVAVASLAACGPPTAHPTTPATHGSGPPGADVVDPP